jgi:three-Cys-motif partner protein
MAIPSGLDFEFDEIGYWSELKLEVIRAYAQEYSRIVKSNGFYDAYIDAFAGAGLHISKESGEFVLGSPLNALEIHPPFDEIHLIDLNAGKADHLRQLTASKSHVSVYEGDCNRVLLDEVFPRVNYKDYRRGLCLLDPYGLHLNWKVIATAGEMKSLEIFLNFPVADMNRNVFWRDASKVSPDQAQRMTLFWGDESWRKVAWSGDGDLFGFETKQPNEAIAEAFRKRLRDVAGFTYVPRPVPMKNTRGAIVYYLYFASPNPTADRIVTHIFDKYRQLALQP